MSLKLHFLKFNLALEAYDKLQKLKQTGSAASHIAHFNELAQFVEMSPTNQLTTLEESLKHKLCVALIHIKWSQSYHQLMEKIIGVNNKLYCLCKLGKKKSPSIKNPKSTSQVIYQPVAAAPVLSTGKPMQIDTMRTKAKFCGPLSQVENDCHWDKGLCGYCGLHLYKSQDGTVQPCLNKLEAMMLNKLPLLWRVVWEKHDWWLHSPWASGWWWDSSAAAFNCARELFYSFKHRWLYPVFQFPSPHFIFSASNPSLNSPSHFFISISLSFPNWKSIRMFALMDSGATTSCISEKFASRHSLSCHQLNVPIPIMAVDDHPIASGLITQDVITLLMVNKHFKVLPLHMVSVGYPIILGLDWIHHHNPKIDWEEMNLSLNCCRLSHTFPVQVMAKGFSTKPKLFSPALNSFLPVGLGSGLSNTPPVASWYSTSPPKDALEDTPSSATSTTPDSTPTHSSSSPSFLSSFIQRNSFGCSTPMLDSPPPPPDIKIVNPAWFKKYTKSNPNMVCMLCYHTSNSPTFINSFSTIKSWDDIDNVNPYDLLPEFTPSDDTDNFEKFIPEKYHPWASSVFNPAEFEKLPPH